MSVAQKRPPQRVAEVFDFEIDKVQGSRFIVRLMPAADADAVVAAQAALRLSHPHSRHVCFAYVGTNPQAVRFSDDGEPSKTAGYPMLKVLLGHSLTGSAALVTRYFGGVKLGTGGLVRAYTRAVVEALRACPLVTALDARRFRLSCSYAQEPRVRYALATAAGHLDQVAYGAEVHMQGSLPLQHYADLRAQLSEQEGLELVALPEQPPGAQ